MKKIFQFFEQELDPAKPILLGISGGPDSLCLFYLLLEYCQKNPLILHLAHVDHGWRKESRTECLALEKLGQDFNIPVHTIRLSQDYEGNLEAASRSARLKFFTETAEKISAQGIILGHQFEDQTETVLKRFLEGASLACLSGMRKVSKFGALKVFRPLLETSKQEILAYLQARAISYFEDPTNADTKFLRARMRKEIFPFLRKSFGKEFQQSIFCISQDAQEMRAYFDEKLAHYLECGITSSFGTFFDFQSNFPKAPLEMHELLRLLGEKFNFSFNRYQASQAISLISSKSANKYLEVDGKTLYFDRGRLFIFNEKIAPLPESAPLKMGVQYFGPWRVTVTDDKACQSLKNSWQDVWNGVCITSLPSSKNYVLTNFAPNLRGAFHGKILDKALGEKKVPRAISLLCPVIKIEEKIAEDFLLGYKHLTGDALIYITLEIASNYRV